MDNVGSKEIGQLQEGSSDFLSLGIGITSAVFHAFGKTLSSNELLINLVIMVLDESAIDSSLMKCLAECSNNADHWSSRRQILSIMADKVNFKDLQRWITNLSRYRFNIARHHLLLHSRGANVQTVKGTRMYIAPKKFDHFLSFITSTHIIQDLPFGEKTLKLSTNTEIKVPNVVRSLIPEHIVLQFLSYCSDVGFVPMSRSTLLKVLSVCSASARKSLQGLDYVSAAGAKAFDELEEVIDKLGDNYGKGFTWAKVQKEKLHLAKRYLKARCTLLKVLSVCSASTRKSLQGLDYVSAAGTKAFDELEEVIDKLGDNYAKGFTWAKVQKEKLHLAKRYLKGDYKVRLLLSRIF